MFIYIATAGGHLDPWDGIESFLVTESMVLKHTAKLDPTVPTIEKLNFYVRYSIYSNKVLQTGKYYDEKTMPLEPVYTVRSLLISAVAVPFYFFALLTSLSPLVVVSLLVNPLLIALTTTVIFCFSVELFQSTRISFILSLIFGLCSFVWPYQNSLWTQPLQGLLLITSVYFIYRSHHSTSSFLCYYLSPIIENQGQIMFAGLGGLFIALSVLAHPTSVILVPGIIIYVIFSLKRNFKALLVFFIATSVVLIFVGVVNYLRFGSFIEFGYGFYGSIAIHDGWKGLIGLIASPGAGLFLYFPASILLPLAAKYMYHDKFNYNSRLLFFLFIYVILVNLIDAGTLSFNYEPFSWWGLGWGPRYLVSILPFVTIMLGYVLLQLKKKKVLLKFTFVILSVIGVYINLIGTLVSWQYDAFYLNQKEKLFGNAWDTIIWNASYSPIVLHTKMLLTNYLSQVDLHKFSISIWPWVADGLTPCSYDTYIFCKFGIIPVVGLIIIIVTIFTLINNDISLIKGLKIELVDSKRRVFKNRQS